MLHDPGEVETGLIAALRHGASRSTLHTIGTGLGGSPDAVDRLLATLAPAFEHEPDPDQATRRAPHSAGRRAPARIAVDADDESFGRRLAGHLISLGYAASLDDAVSTDVDLAVIVAAWVIPPARHLPWLRADVPHLALVFDDAGTRVGPLVEPGTGPCLRCVDLARRDDDAAWPVIAAQLARRPSPDHPARTMHDIAALAASAIDDRLTHGDRSLAAASLVVSGPGAAPRRREHPPHAECGCRAPGESATALAHPGTHRPGEPSSVRVVVAHG